MRRSVVGVVAALLLGVGLVAPPNAAADPGDRDTTFTPLALDNIVVSTAELSDGKYLVGGYFTDAGGDADTDFLARVDSDGTRDTTFTPLALNDAVYWVVELSDGKYLVGGYFTDAGGDADTDYVARLDSDGTRDSTFTPLSLNGVVYGAVELPSGKYLIGGDFTDAGGDADTDYIARLDSDGTRDTSFTPLSLNDFVVPVLDVSGSKYLIGGSFTNAGGDAATDRVARLNSDGTRDTSFTPLSLNNDVYSAAELSDGKYLIGGWFTDAGGSASTDHLARLDSDGTRDTSFTPLSLNSTLYGVRELSDGRYLIGGDFTDAGGNADTDYLARLDSDGTRDTDFTPLALNGIVVSVAELTSGKYLVGGFFTDAGGDADTNFLARLLSTYPAPDAPSSVTYSPRRGNRYRTRVQWAGAVDATGYEVFVSGVSKCVTEADTSFCLLRKRYGPDANIKVRSLGEGGTTSSKTAAKFTRNSEPVRVGTIHFPPNSPDLTAKAKRQARRIARLLAAQGFRHVTLTGYTAHVPGVTGGKAFRRQLSQDRARAVRDILQRRLDKLGADVRIHIQAKGSKHPVDSNKTARGRKQNRRATIALT